MKIDRITIKVSDVVNGFSDNDKVQTEIKKEATHHEQLLQKK